MVSHTVDTTQRIASLRALMSSAGPDGAPLQAYVVPSEDQHFSEYGAKCDERRAFISGFNGSAGYAIVTDKDAYLFTDGRYFLQAEQQLDRNWTLMKQGLPDVPTWQEFLHQKLPGGSKIGMDPTLISATDAQKLDSTLQPIKSSLVSVSENLVDQVWGATRPPRPTNRAFPLSTEFAGRAHTDKLTDVRAEVKKAKSSALVVSALDEVAWLFNLRGSDVDYNPVFFGYAIVTPESATLFVDLEKLEEVALKHLGDAVKVQPYTAFWDALKKLGEDTKADSKVLISDKASFAVFNALGGTSKVTMAPSPVALLKSRKNDTEVAGFRASHIRDGAALARYFSWLERTLEKGEEEVTEWSAAAVLEKFRSEGEHFVGLSFPTISSTGPNGAIIHYAPEENDCAVIRKDQVYLCDSGAQYLDGTTDVTRTWHFGTPKDEEKRAFTRVLQGHIAIDTAVFPSGTTGYIIDSWARRALWKDGLDYRHGTGHGVGHFLNVHEGPQGIGVRIAYNSTPLEVGMTVSNEPGYYADGRFGIRIESIVVVRKSKTPNNFGDKGYLEFENLTMCPIHKKMIDVSLLSVDEQKWVNSYHKEVWEKVSPLLERDPEAKAWLGRETAPL